MTELNKAIDEGIKKINSLEPLYQPQCFWVFQSIREVLQAMKQPEHPNKVSVKELISLIESPTIINGRTKWWVSKGVIPLAQAIHRLYGGEKC